ncbi:biotin--[acetyl-CoA-carboxylase] ligase [Dysgonomonas sp. ZJ709]|uniref:biotin--[acetyl-CoA-carboxylase] ligase n=1 Tax=Dysgonomonas sp. ZJ709 TaxID=2709797 RepID=UPI0013EC2A83|nr:biotin--[acetyl-CoA-carboxylase] ligase [Dysgonomonas sp. ZJ709]
MPPVIHLEETFSTNTYLKDLLLKQNVEEGTIIHSDYQSAGKGQRGNNWESEHGKNLLFSIVLYPTMINANEQFIISQFISLALKDTLSKYADNITIKWPNDIYWKEKKICGILIGNALLENKINQSVIGIGININQERFITEVPNPVSLKKITGNSYDLKEILTELANQIQLHYRDVKEGNFNPIVQQYKDSLFRSKGYHLYHDGVMDFLAKIKDIEPSGILVLETMEGVERKFAFKEVKYII